MQIGFSFSLLLASLFLAFSASALPVKRNTGMVTLPLTRLQQRTDLHPTIVR